MNEQPKEDRTWQKGRCHCGQVRFEVFLPAAIEVIECNCSICAMTGYEHIIVRKDEFKLLTDEDALNEYRFNTKTAKHLFCKTCGVKPFYVPRSHPEGYSVNMRCLDRSAFSETHNTSFDGRNWEENINTINPSTKDL